MVVYIKGVENKESASELVGKDEAIKKSFIETTGSFVEALWGDANDDTRQQILSVLKKGINV